MKFFSFGKKKNKENNKKIEKVPEIKKETTTKPTVEKHVELESGKVKETKNEEKVSTINLKQPTENSLSKQNTVEKNKDVKESEENFDEEMIEEGNEEELELENDDNDNDNENDGGDGDVDSDFEIVQDDEDMIDMSLSNDVPTRAKDEFESLNAEEIVNKQQNEVLELSSTLDVPVSIGGVLLRSYRWNKEKLFTDFFDNKNKVFKEAGVNLDSIISKFITGKKGEIVECDSCLEEVDGSNMYSLSCKHFMCKDCWRDFLHVAISDGPSCLFKTCPQTDCKIVIDENLVVGIVDSKHSEKYAKYLARSFVDDNPNIKWCPQPDCGKAVLCVDSTTNFVKCKCSFKFCFKCNAEAHAPCSCVELKNWKKKEQDESETANWFTANTKDCPKCSRSIEKNGGCNHMSCSLCKYEFCWICMDDWKLHGGNTGGFYKCNRFKPEELDKKEKNTERKAARAALEKYMHYFKRYANHEQSQKFEKKLRQLAEEKMKDLQLINKYSSWIDVQYIQKAVEQLVECRRSLKFTYVYAYYLDDGPEKNLFEYLQEQLERVTENLSEILEGDVKKFNRDNIINITKSAQTRLSHLITGVEEGLSTNNSNKK